MRKKLCFICVAGARDSGAYFSHMPNLELPTHTHTHMGKAINAHGGVASVCEHCTIVTE